MAQLKDSIVRGNLRVTDTTLTDTLQSTTIRAPSTSGGSAYSAGTNGQVLTSNGTTSYWGAANNHTHLYAGSASAGGSASSAVKLDTATAGNSRLPVYFTGGQPSAISVRNNTTKGAIGWASGADDNVLLVTTNSIAYWNGAYSGTSSNLTYCNQGAFGTIVTKSTTDYSKVTSSTTNGNIKIDGTETEVYFHPQYIYSGPIDPVANSGLYRIKLDNEGHVCFVDYVLKTDIPSLDYLPLTGGTVTGNVYLKSTSGDSPALVFQRGTFVDNLNDWKIYVSGGGLYFAQTWGTDTENWVTKMYFHPSNGKLYIGDTAVSLEGHTHDYSKVSLTRNLTSGTKIGTITIDGTATDLYCQTNTDNDTKVTQSSSSTSDFRPIVYGKTRSTDPTALATEVTDLVYVSTTLYARPSDGRLFSNGGYTSYGGNIIMHAATASGDTPALEFRRGTNTDNYLDWRMYVSNGYMYVQRTKTNENVWETKLLLDPTNGNQITGSLSTVGGSFKTTTSTAGLYLIDSNNTAYASVYDNNTNLWIGATEASGYHHKGKLYLSAGWSGASLSAFTAQKTIYVSIPSYSNSTWSGTQYPIVHSGNLIQGTGITISTANDEITLSHTTANVSTLLNLLTTGNSDVVLDDYFISQYAGGGTTTTTYHRRPVSKIWNTFKSLITIATTGSGNAITSVSIANDGNNRKITFTKGSTFALASELPSYGNVGDTSRPVYFSGGTPTTCYTPSSGKYFTGVPYISAAGVMEIGKYIDFHVTDASTTDYDVRVTAASNQLSVLSNGTSNTTFKVVQSGTGYLRLGFQSTNSSTLYDAHGIVCYPMTTTGMNCIMAFGGGVMIGGGESALTMYNNHYANIDTAENENLYLTADADIHLIPGVQDAYSDQTSLDTYNPKQRLSLYRTPINGTYVEAKGNMNITYNPGDSDTENACTRLKITSKAGSYSQLTFNNQSHSNPCGIKVFFNLTDPTLVLDVNGSVMIGGGDSPQKLYDANYDSIKTAAQDQLYLCSDEDIHIIARTQGGSALSSARISKFKGSGTDIAGPLTVLAGQSTSETADLTCSITNTNKVKFRAAGQGVYGIDSNNTEFCITCDNGSNLWLGAFQSSGYHHKGSTYISTGWTGTLPTAASSSMTGNSSIYISVPKYTVNSSGIGSWNHTSYTAIHSGNWKYETGMRVTSIPGSGVASKPWAKMATCTMTGASQDTTLTLLISRSWGDVGKYTGILVAHVRTGDSSQQSSGTYFANDTNLRWIVRGPSIDKTFFVLTCNRVSSTQFTVELWAKYYGAYDGWNATILSEFSRTAPQYLWSVSNGELTDAYRYASYSTGVTKTVTSKDATD